jgi:hypothetical protein
MGDTVDLLPDRRVDARMAMAVDVAPHAGSAVQVLTAVDVNQPALLGARNDEWLVLGHLSEGVPVMVAVPAAEFDAGSLRVHERCGDELNRKR